MGPKGMVLSTYVSITKQSHRPLEMHGHYAGVTIIQKLRSTTLYY